MATLRLDAALDWINTSDNLADIGCDHGYLAIKALEKGVKNVQLVDNKQGPLSVAKKNLSNYSFDAFISFTLASGLSQLNPNIDTIAILGMGGELISSIINDNLKLINSNMKLILEANTKIPFLRKFLFEHNFNIIDEKIVKENDKYYELLLVKKTNNKILYTESDLLLGPVLRKEKSPLFLEKWTKIYHHYQDILANSQKKPELILKESKIIEEIL